MSYDPHAHLAAKVRLRRYQEETEAAYEAAYHKGIKRQLIVLPTGAGKSVLFSRIPSRLGMRPVLALAHKIELLDQMAAHFSREYPDWKIQIEQADRPADPDADIVCASTQTLGRKNSKRIEKWGPEYFDLIICDEAHRSVASQHVNILKYFNPKLLVGVTATIGRSDGVELSNLYDEIVYSRQLEELMIEGEADKELGPYFAKLRPFTIRTGTDISEVSVRAGDFAEDELAQAVNVDQRNSMIVSAVEEHAYDRKHILVFAASVEHAETLAQQFVDRGHTAEFVCGKTPKITRADIFNRFRTGETRCLTNFGLFVEGVDVPQIDCIVMARPTKSMIVYQQAIGRGTRYLPTKKDTIILDFVDNCKKFKPVSIGELFGVREVDFLGEDVVIAAQKARKARDEGVKIEDGDTSATIEMKQELAAKVAKGTIYVETVAEATALFSMAEPCEEVRQFSEFPWIKRSDHEYTITMPDKSRVDMKRNALGKWNIRRYATGQELGFAQCKDDKAEVPFKWADGYIKRNYAGYPGWRVKSSHAKWRMKPASPAQVAALKNMGIRVIPPNCTAGQASDMMDYAREQKKNAPTTRQNQYGSGRTSHVEAKPFHPKVIRRRPQEGVDERSSNIATTKITDGEYPKW